jgi:hypothetical protein
LNNIESRRADIRHVIRRPENQLVSLAHSLLARGIIDEAELKQRLTRVRERLEA